MVQNRDATDIIINQSFSVRFIEVSILPEFYVGFAGLSVIIYCSLTAYNKIYEYSLLQFAAISVSIFIMYLILGILINDKLLAIKHLSLDFSFLNSSLGELSKIVTVIAALMCVYAMREYVLKNKINNTEYNLIILYAVLGLMLLVDANEYTVIYLALELQGIALYLMTGIKKYSIHSIESGLKYFILASLSGAYFVLGWSLLYGITGLFILMNFHFFFFNIFSDVSEEKSSIVESKGYPTQKKERELYTTEKKSGSIDDHYFNANNVLIPQTENSNLNGLLNVIIYLAFNTFYYLPQSLAGAPSGEASIKNLNENYQITLICCCEDNNAPHNRYTHQEKLITENVIMEHARDRNIKMSCEEYMRVHCNLCKDVLLDTGAIDITNSNTIQNMISYYDMEYSSQTERECWHCKNLAIEFKKEVLIEKRRIKLMPGKVVDMNKRNLAFVDFQNYYYNLFTEYYLSEFVRLSPENLAKTLIKSIMSNCARANAEGRHVPFCRYVVEAHKRTWEDEKLCGILVQKIAKTCSTQKGRHYSLCKELRKYSIIEIDQIKSSKDLLNNNEKTKFLFNKSILEAQTDQRLVENFSLTDYNKCNSKNNIKNTYEENFKTIREEIPQCIIMKSISNKKNQKTEIINLYNRNSIETNELKIVGSSLTLILISFFFKLAVTPFHLWSLDIYEGAPTSSTTFFAVATKFSIIVILMKISYCGFYSLLKTSLYQAFLIASTSSVLVGSIAGLAERKLKSLLAYSSINNIGYILLSLSVGTLNGVKTALFYLIIYISSSLATWSGFISIQRKKNIYVKKQNKDFADITMLRRANPVLAILLQIALFSTAGLPPFIGFITKMNIFLTSIESHLYLVSLILILLSVMSTFYYLRLIKTMYFEKMLIGKLYKDIKIEQSSINSILGFFLPYQFLKPWLSIFFSYKTIIC